MIQAGSRKKRGRGADFKNRFKASRWAEDILFASLNENPNFVAIRFGLSKVVEGDEVDVGDDLIKEPDLILFVKTT